MTPKRGREHHRRRRHRMRLGSHQPTCRPASRNLDRRPSIPTGDRTLRRRSQLKTLMVTTKGELNLSLVLATRRRRRVLAAAVSSTFCRALDVERRPTSPGSTDAPATATIAQRSVNVDAVYLATVRRVDQINASTWYGRDHLSIYKLEITARASTDHRHCPFSI